MLVMNNCNCEFSFVIIYHTGSEQIELNQIKFCLFAKWQGEETAKKQYSYLSLLPPHQAKKYTIAKAKASQTHWIKTAKQTTNNSHMSNW